MADEYLSSDFNYKKYSLENLEEWVHDSLNCEDTTPQEIYDIIVNAVNENIKYHKTYLNKNTELLSLLKGHRNVDFLEEYQTKPFSQASEKDWEDFWGSDQYTEEEMDAMCDVAEDKEKCREYNLREAEYYTKRAELDAQHSKYYYDTGRNKSYDQMIAEGWTMTADGFWVKE